ncbi:hypothetical protein RF11_11821 [Thelohanellus kitauei]|uniref:Uncharacterized protein n=1 Tax=Thelohanellus kitauei TaxID=669202 RepID=A0A0C2IYS8_THEKT|nr:hypothetical protein RF11_11821 [Thelohanellus kitauei]
MNCPHLVEQMVQNHLDPAPVPDLLYLRCPQETLEYASSINFQSNSKAGHHRRQGIHQTGYLSLSTPQRLPSAAPTLDRLRCEQALILQEDGMDLTLGFWVGSKPYPTQMFYHERTIVTSPFYPCFQNNHLQKQSIYMKR